MRGATDRRYKLIRSLTPENMYAVQNINGLDYWGVNRGSSATKMYQSWLDAAESDPQVDRLVERIRYYPEFQLFDLQKDPWELKNLAGNPDYMSKVQEVKTTIVGWMKQQGDEGHLDGTGIKYSEMKFADSPKQPRANRVGAEVVAVNDGAKGVPSTVGSLACRRVDRPAPMAGNLNHQR